MPETLQRRPSGGRSRRDGNRVEKKLEKGRKRGSGGAAQGTLSALRDSKGAPSMADRRMILIGSAEYQTERVVAFEFGWDWITQIRLHLNGIFANSPSNLENCL